MFSTAFFLDFASGKVLPDEVNKKGDKIMMRQKPYSEYAGKETESFKNVSPACFAISLAALYPFLAENRSEWATRLKKNVAYPVTSLWPVRVVKRYVHFIKVVFDNIDRVFTNYEEEGGAYYSDEDGAGSAHDDDEEEDSSDCDNVF